jgi:hypothetical protein
MKLAIFRLLAGAKCKFNAIFSVEAAYLKSIMEGHSTLALSIAFFCGLIMGGILATPISHFVLIAIIGGFAFAILYGHSVGLPTFLSCFLVVLINALTAYATLKIMRIIERYPRVKPYLEKLRGKYEDEAMFLFKHAGKHLMGVLALFTFLFGWWAAVVFAYILNIDAPTAMKASVLGLLFGAGVSWATYEGLIKIVLNPILAVVVTIIIFGVVVKIVSKMAENERNNASKRRINSITA